MKVQSHRILSLPQYGHLTICNILLIQYLTWQIYIYGVNGLILDDDVVMMPFPWLCC